MKIPNLSQSTLRLAGCHQQFIQQLPHLGETYLQARNRGGGLGKHVPGISPILIDNLDYAFDPDTGVGISLTDLIAIHSSSLEMESCPVPVIDMEFGSFPGGLSFCEIPGLSVEGATAELTSHFGGKELKHGELESWRTEIQPDPELCRSCRRDSEIRIGEMDKHPLFGIMDHAASEAIPLDCRLTSDHVDLTASLTPSQMHHASGVIIVSGEKCRSSLHIDFRYVHTMTIHCSKIDDRNYSILEIYDMLGAKNFQIMSDVPEINRHWQSICEESSKPSC